MGSATAVQRSFRRRERSEVGLVAALVAAAALGWVLAYALMAGMDSGPGTELGDPPGFALVWIPMMMAMMLPPLMPMVTAYAGAHRWGRDSRRALTSAAFVAGYLLPWWAVGMVIYAIVEGVRSLHLDVFSWGHAGPYLAGGVLLGAALYQLTTLKDASLRHCRNPSVLLERWRPGVFGAARTGIDHGGVCVACCWAMMSALFALGVMSIGWMAFIALLLAAEKLLPWKAAIKYGVAVLLATLAIAVVLAPDDVPGFKVPGSTKMSPAMGATWPDQPERVPPSAGHA